MIEKAKPIIFSPWSVRKILTGDKTETRRTGKRFEKVKPGDLLYVREAFSILALPQDDSWVRYKADFPGCIEHAWKSPIIMPRIASRIILRVDRIRKEKLQDIGQGGIEREGIKMVCRHRWPSFLKEKRGVVQRHTVSDPTTSYAHLWDCIAKPGQKFKDNPNVYAIRFILYWVKGGIP